MEKRLNAIQQFISKLKGVSIEIPFSLDENYNLVGRVKVSIDAVLEEGLEFDVRILPEYPLKRKNTEAITFTNIDYLEYGHVMGDGSICIHTSHHHDLEKKIKIDFDSLNRWIWKYFLNKEIDEHYEHLILQPSEFKEIHFAFLFTEVDHTFKKHNFGFFEYSRISDGTYTNKNIFNHVVQNFRDANNKIISYSKWSSHIRDIGRNNIGIYIFLNEPPVRNKKFIINNWEDLEPLVNQDFQKFLYAVQKNNKKIFGYPMPLLVGYKITEDESHWQVALLEIGKFPIETVKIEQKWGGLFKSEKITWGITRNCSYDYFFGRGRLSDKITKSKILIIGVGAIGSLVAVTLTRCGCTQLNFVDYDIKEPENVCRSEYSFLGGITNKVNELMNELVAISPFIEAGILDDNFFQMYSKTLQSLSNSKMNLEKSLEEYDIIVDCSTDNDLLYVFNDLKIKRYINLSITNKAKNLVCAVEPKSYSWVMNQFENVLNNELEDVHNPTGCWSPTFKASYNDINVLVQYAIKHINLLMINDEPLRNFVINTDIVNGFSMKLNEF